MTDGCANVLSRERAEEDESAMRALSTETTLTTGQAVQRAGRCAEKNKTNCCSHETLLHNS